ANGTYTAPFTGIVVGTATTIGATISGTPVASTALITVTPGPVSASQSTMVPSPASIVAGGGPSPISLTVRDANNNPIPGAFIILIPPLDLQSSLTPLTGTTNASGIFTASLTSTLAGVKTIVGTANLIFALPQTTVTVTPAAVSATQTTVAVAPGSISSDGGSTTI